MIRAAVVVALLAATLFTANAAAPVAPVESVDSAELRAALTAPRIRDHLTALASIARANGGNRSMGTPGYQASVDYVRQRLVAAGYQVSVQPFRVPYFVEVTAPSLSQERPARRVYSATNDLRTMSYSGSGDVTAAVVGVDLTLPPSAVPSSTSGCEPADFAAFTAGAVALMQRGSCPFTQKTANARAAGAAAVLVMNEGQPDRRDAVSGTLEGPVDIPVLGVSFE